MADLILACGHPLAGSLFETKAGGQRPIVAPPPRNGAGIVLGPAVAWCVDDGWQVLTDEQYGALAAEVAR